MAKKKAVDDVDQTMQRVTAADLTAARDYIDALKVDVYYAKAKKNLSKAFGWSNSYSNAVVMCLHQEGFLASEDGEQGNCFSHPEAETKIGVVRGARRQEEMAVVAVDDDSVSFPLGMDFELPGARYELRRTLNKVDWRIAKQLKPGQTRWICRASADNGYAGKRGKNEPIAVQPISPFAPFTIYLDPKSLPKGVKLGDNAFEVEIVEIQDGWSGAELLGRFVRLIGQCNDPLGEVAIAAAEHGVPVEFNDETLAEAEAFADEVDGRALRHRVDLRDLPFVTIDGEDARDFDDAIYCTDMPDGGWRLLVAIADVSHYVRPGSPLDKEAQKRATSVYFPASVVPMLPEKLSNGLCSLNPGVDRLVMVCDAVIDPKGKTTAYQFYPAVINSHGRLTYNLVWAALQNNAEAVEVLGERMQDITRLYALYKSLRAARRARHTLDFATAETKAVFDDKGNIARFERRESNDAHRLIEECMLVANVCAADFALQRKRDTLFRVHDKPEEDRLRTLNSVLVNFGEKLKDASPESFAALVERTKDNEFVQVQVLRTMSRACYTPDNIGHFGLQFDAYAHFTSPIRRYPDLLLHRTIRGILSRRVYTPEVVFDDTDVMEGFHVGKLKARAKDKAAPGKPEHPRGEQAQKRHAAWARLGLICSAAERRADDATRDVMNFLKCRYMLDLTEKHGKTRRWPATVTGMIGAGLFVQLDDIGLEGFVHVSNLGAGFFEFDEKQMLMRCPDSGESFRMGDSIEVKVEDVDLENRRMSFVVAGSSAKAAASRRRKKDSSERYADKGRRTDKKAGAKSASGKRRKRKAPWEDNWV